ncbi:hypothetical protein AO385_0319 [Moraxella catarrhalis]|uniref:Uncharacterized protein n=1 Tax=Moraxella catarrhalis TaxID=480 RepID=A0A198UFK2_MORCA|nr:hypothetical protein AO384_1648 [Moraxella catarrhalis]OAU99171.1 hypothetical protein AO383_0241 [Moraxella catarrhalis]OAV03933.1 hypothetical protein AO385_0319 [Moraxella catarrhalis]
MYISQIAETMLIKTQNYYKAVLAMFIYADYHMVGFEHKEHINY